MSAVTKILGLEPRMIDTPPKQRTFSLRVGCRDCGCKLEDREVETTTMGPIERVDHLMALAKSKGWATGKDGTRAWVICVGCLERIKKAETGPLPAFSEKCACVKCGNEDTTIRFCDGHGTCELGAVRDHLHRGCPRCGYTFIQGCKDEKVPDAQT